eukprot:CAMPEP_0176424454 /NCGR_PEP_ID=MMETSP0127-20121128/10845_1 /TAXON_ID=938130 /ORGANISM="Platyophrya macrostoma, Strain WH" /LENGTH=213 /DNA_ID=CAMNT_0017805511 /DNA_START=32 /DNA_END=673 /DNA_ORIENTATION=+
MNATSGAGGDFDYLFKLLLIGNSGVGKSCMLMRYSENSFTTNFFNTIGVDFKIKSIVLDQKNVKLQIWDTAGQDRFRTITCSYYKGAQGIMIVYDITDKESFDSVKGWMSEIEKYAQENVIKILVGNKSDMGDKRRVTFEEGQEFARQNGMSFFETSAKSSTNVDLAFQTIAKTIMDKVNVGGGTKDKGGVKLKDLRQDPPKSKDNNGGGGCC